MCRRRRRCRPCGRSCCCAGPRCRPLRCLDWQPSSCAVHVRRAHSARTKGGHRVNRRGGRQGHAGRRCRGAQHPTRRRPRRRLGLQRLLRLLLRLLAGPDAGVSQRLMQQAAMHCISDHCWARRQRQWSLPGLWGAVNIPDHGLQAATLAAAGAGALGRKRSIALLRGMSSHLCQLRWTLHGPTRRVLRLR